jgi:nucleotide-binding universal stress UspA family protein
MHGLFSHSRGDADPPNGRGCAELLVNNRVLDPPQCANAFRTQECAAPAPKTVLVPLTLSSGSHAALVIAANLAVVAGAKLVLLHVVETDIAGAEGGIQLTRTLHDSCHRADSELRKLAGCLGDRAPTEILVCEGRPAEVIVETARRLNADRIVMCTHGYCGWLRSLHRNTALNVLRQAPCGVRLVAPTRDNATFGLMILDRPKIDRSCKRVVFHEKQSPFRSLLRVLFS